MANVSFHIGTKDPTLLSTIVEGGIYVNQVGGGIYYAPITGGADVIPLASKVEFTQTLTSGHEIGTISINGNDTVLYSDGKCTYSHNISGNNEYPLLFKNSTSTTTTPGYPSFGSTMTANPRTGKITASSFKGDLVLSSVSCAVGDVLSHGFYFLEFYNDYTSFSYVVIFQGAGYELRDSSGDYILRIDQTGTITQSGESGGNASNEMHIRMWRFGV